MDIVGCLDHYIKNKIGYSQRKKDDDMKKIKFLLLVFLMMGMSLCGIAQGDKPVEMADTMRSNGRIYVVIAVILTILVGLVLYIVRLDKKLSRLEKEK